MLANIIVAFPLLTVSVIIYTMLAVLSGQGWDQGVAFSPMWAGTTLNITVGDVFIWSSLVLLFAEIVKSTATNAKAIINHGLSAVLTIICILLLATTPMFVTTTFLTLTVMSTIDMVAGFVITIVSARRDFDGSGGAVLHH